MNVETTRLDRRFGLFPWHGVGWVNAATETWSYRDDPVISKIACDCIKYVFRPDAASETSRLPGPAIKLDMRSKALVILLYQAIVERLGISRALTCDEFTDLVTDNSSDLECGCLGLPDGEFQHFRCSECRHRTGVIAGKIADGEFFRNTIRSIINFVQDARMHNNLYPITMTGETDSCKLLPDPGLNVLSTGLWRCACFYNFGSIDSVAPLRALAQQFGFTDVSQLITRWTNDMSMRDAVPGLGIESKGECDDICGGYFLRDLFEELVKHMPIKSSVYPSVKSLVQYLVRHVSVPGRCYSDISGRYLSIFGNIEQSELVRKHYGSAFGYGWTVLGGFGQNIARYRNKGVSVNQTSVCASRSVHVQLVLVHGDCGLEFVTTVCDLQKPSTNFSCETASSITAQAEVRGYTGPLAWAGGPLLLYLKEYDKGCKSASDYHFTPGVVTIDSLLSQGKDCATDFALYQVTSQGVATELGYGLQATWTNTGSSDGDLGAQVCVNCVDFCTNYPARQVLDTHFAELIKDISLLFVLHDRALVDRCSMGPDSRESCAYSGVEFQKDIDVKYDEEGNWICGPMIGLLTDIYRYIVGHLSYYSSGWFIDDKSFRQVAEELPSSVNVVRKFPVTCEDIWGQGDNSLLNPLSAEEIADQIRQHGDDWIICGEDSPGGWLVPVRISFSRQGGGSVWPTCAIYCVCGHCWSLPIDPIEDREFKEAHYSDDGTIEFIDRNVKGWIVGYKSWALKNKFLLVENTWEPYYLRRVDTVSVGDVFGFVRWKYVTSRRQVG